MAKAKKTQTKKAVKNDLPQNEVTNDSLKESTTDPGTGEIEKQNEGLKDGPVPGPDFSSDLAIENPDENPDENPELKSDNLPEDQEDQEGKNESQIDHEKNRISNGVDLLETVSAIEHFNNDIVLVKDAKKCMAAFLMTFFQNPEEARSQIEKEIISKPSYAFMSANLYNSLRILSPKEQREVILKLLSTMESVLRNHQLTSVALTNLVLSLRA